VHSTLTALLETVTVTIKYRSTKEELKDKPITLNHYYGNHTTTDILKIVQQFPSFIKQLDKIANKHKKINISYIEYFSNKILIRLKAESEITFDKSERNYGKKKPKRKQKFFII